MRFRLLLAGLCALPAAAQQVPSAAEERAVYGWFDRLGLPDLGSRPLVEVATGRWVRSGTEPPRNTWRIAFLMDDDGARFEVFSLDRAREEYDRHRPESGREHERCDYRVVDLVEHCTRVLQARHEAENDVDRYRAFAHPQVHHTAGTELCLLAWVCRESDRGELALELLSAARTAYDRVQGDQGKTIDELLAADLAHVDMWRLVLAFGDPKVDYAELLQRTRQHLGRFPDSAHRERAGDMEEVLARMVDEEREHGPLEDPAAELVWQLRHQNGQQWSQPGSCNVFFDPRGEDSPAHRLKAMGFDAVPALIAALDDPRFTRSVGYHRNFYFSHHVLRVGDAAAQILSEITGRRFWLEQPAVRKAEAESWWREVRDKGLRVVMGEAVRRGDWAGAMMGERLLQRHSDDALADLLAGAGAAVEPHVHQAYHALILQVPGEASTEFLRRALREDVHDRCRVTAAHALWQRSREDEALDAIIDLWNRMWVRGPESLEAEMVARFLATRGRLRAIEALARHKHHLNDDMLRDLGGDVTAFPSLSTPSRSHVAPPVEQQAGVETAVEDLLVSLLDDTVEYRGNYGGVIDARRCDFAARALSRRWPGRYGFRFEEPIHSRDRRIHELRNAWRGARGLDPLPAPVADRVPPVAREQVDALFAGLVRTRDPAERAAIRSRIVELGPGAVVFVHERMANAPESLHAELADMARAMSIWVREVTLPDGSTPWSDAFAARLSALQRRPLRIEDAQAIVVDFVKAPPEAVDGLTLRVERSDHWSGLLLEVGLRAGLPPPADAGKVHHSSAVTLGREVLDSSTGVTQRASAGRPDRYRRFFDALAKALAGAPDQPIAARIALHF